MSGTAQSCHTSTNHDDERTVLPSTSFRRGQRHGNFDTPEIDVRISRQPLIREGREIHPTIVLGAA